MNLIDGMSKFDDHNRRKVYMEKAWQPEDPPENPYFAFGASLRIFGEGLEFKEISRTLGVQPTHQHRKGERRSSGAVPYRHDGWLFQPSVDESRPLAEHVLALWAVVKPHLEYLRLLKRRCVVNVFCTYSSNSATAGFEVDYRCLELFTALEVPFDISVVVV